MKASAPREPARRGNEDRSGWGETLSRWFWSGIAMGCATFIGMMVGSREGTKIPVLLVAQAHGPGATLTSGSLVGLGIGLSVGAVVALWLCRTTD
jgi:hypothetical protein